MAEQVDMETILDEALDDLDDGDDDDDDDDDEKAVNVTTTSEISEPRKPTASKIKAQHEDSRDFFVAPAEPKTGLQQQPNQSEGEPTVTAPEQMFQSMLKEFIQAEEDGSDPDARLGQFMNQIQSQLSTTDDGKNAPSGASATKKGSTTSRVESDVDKTINAILEEMAKANIGEANNTTTNTATEDDILKNMFGNFAAMSGGDDDDDLNSESFNPDSIIDGMMEQLLSKDLMYEPMKQVAEKFPQWLEENESKLPSNDYEERCKQHECFKKLVRVYEKEPGNVSELLELMQQVQEYGQPPQEIINEIAPGLELDEEGMPKINPLEGMPFGGGGEECRIM